MIRLFGSITLLSPPERSRLVRTKGNTRKIKHLLCRKTRVSARKISRKLDASERNVRWIMKNDLGVLRYKKIIEPLPSDDQKINRKKNCKSDSNKSSTRRNYEDSPFG